MIAAPTRTFVPAARRDGPRWPLAAAVAVALGVHVALAFAVRLQTTAPVAPPRVIELSLTTTEALFGPPTATPETAPSTADTASPKEAPSTGEAVVLEQAVASKPQQAGTAASPSTQRIAEPPPQVAADRLRPLAGKSVADLAAAVAGAALQTPATRLSARVTRLGHGAPQRPDFAYYLDSWRRKVERIGELNYPREARTQGITGSLRLLVSIAPDGALRGAKVLESSGQRLLDDAALRIVRLAAPYAPFSPAMRDSTDLLEIERVWQFRNRRFAP